MDAAMTLTRQPAQDAANDPDRILLEQFLAHADRAALLALFQRHAETAYRIVLRMSGNQADAEDAVQDGFLQVIASARQYRGSGSVRSWILTLIVNCHHRRVRSDRRRRLRERTIESAPTHVRDSIDDQARAAVLAGLMQLPERYRLPLSMRHLDGLAYSDIATALGRNENTVRTQVERGLDSLRALLSRRGVALSSAAIFGSLEGAQATLPTGLETSIQRIADNAVVPPFSSFVPAGVVATVLLSAAAVVALITLSASLREKPGAGRNALAKGDEQPAPGADAKPAKKQALPAWRKGMKAGQFSPIPGTAPKNFDLDPGYWENRVINDWDGLQIDENRGVVYSALGGGHSSQEQNGVYKIDVMADKPTWQVVRKSTRYEPGKNGGEYFPDGRPVARHTYSDGNVVEVDGKPIILFVEAVAASPASEFHPNVDAFHLDKGDWDLKGGDWQDYPGRVAPANCVAKDPRTQHIWVADVGAGIHHLDPATRKWTTVTPSNGFGFNNWGVGYCGSVIDAKRDRFILAGSASYKQGPAFGVWNIAAGKYEDRALTGPGIAEGAGGYTGLVHDTIKDRYLWIHGTGKLVAVDPETFATTVVASAAPAPQGPQNKIAFVKSLGGCIYLPSWDSDVLFLPVE